MLKIMLVSFALLPMYAMADEAVSCLNTRGGPTGMQIYNICDRNVTAAYCVGRDGLMCSVLDTRVHLTPGMAWTVGGHNANVRYNACFGDILKIVGTRVACKESR